jgi:hypothetical protein
MQCSSSRTSPREKKKKKGTKERRERGSNGTKERNGEWHSSVYASSVGWSVALTLDILEY